MILTDGARLCPQGQPQRVAGLTAFGFPEVLRLIPLRGTLPRSVPTDVRFCILERAHSGGKAG